MIKASNTEMPPLEFELVPITPLPEVRESNTELAWLDWDCAVAARDEEGAR